LIALLVAGGAAAYSWSQKQYYVALDGENVAIFRGIQPDLPGLRMHRVAEDTPVTVQSLPDYRAEQVRSGIAADDLDHAREIVTELTTFARVCPTPEPSPTSSPKDGSTKGDSTSGKTSGNNSQKQPDKKQSESASKSASPSPSPSPTIHPPDCVEPADLGSGAAEPSPEETPAKSPEPTPTGGAS
jgi:hypothetical protein